MSFDVNHIKTTHAVREGRRLRQNILIKKRHTELLFKFVEKYSITFCLKTSVLNAFKTSLF